MQISRENLSRIEGQPHLSVPNDKIFELPEKILQFGTGVLLRALPDYFVDKANKQGVFNGRIVVVKSTGGTSKEFDAQNGLYTVCVRGEMNGATVKEDIINASISRVLPAKTAWQEILQCAHNPEMKIVFSNTTEVGIQLVDENILEGVPESFPGKLLAFLLERYKAFKGSDDSGMVIVPTELITDNGDLLESIVLELAHRNKLDYAFIEWLENANTFCNSLVDRIVPGKPSADELAEIQNQLGYTDDLLTMSEPFRLWAIEGDEQVKNLLSFFQVDDAVKIEPDITLFKELKLRLLNGTHTYNCGLAFLSGFDITREAVKDEIYGTFTKQLMKQIAASIPYEIDENVKAAFAKNTFERFCNPFIDHQWQSITVQVSSKMRMRNVPLLVQHYKQSNQVPMYMATGFAAYIAYMKIIAEEEGKYFGERKGERYEVKDDAAEYFYTLWKENDACEVVAKVLRNEKLWETDLSALPGFEEAVKLQLHSILSNGALATALALETAAQTI